MLGDVRGSVIQLEQSGQRELAQLLAQIIEKLPTAKLSDSEKDDAAQLTRALAQEAEKQPGGKLSAVGRATATALGQILTRSAELAGHRAPSLVEKRAALVEGVVDGGRSCVERVDVAPQSRFVRRFLCGKEPSGRHEVCQPRLFEHLCPVRSPSHSASVNDVVSDGIEPIDRLSCSTLDTIERIRVAQKPSGLSL